MMLLVAASFGASAAGYYTQAGKVYDPNGQEIQIRGISHFGFNGTTLQPQYLWAMGWKDQIAQIKSLGFNAVRVPFVPDTLYNTTPVHQLGYIDPNRNADLLGKTPLQVLDLWMAEADRQGLYILLDFHSVSMQRQYPTWFVSSPADFNLTYNKQAYSKEDWTRDLTFVARRYANISRFIGIDLYNEPNGIVRWSSGDANAANPIYFWKAAAEMASAAVLAANPRLLVFVQGINGNFDGRENSNIPMNWGEDFQPQAYQPLNIPNDKLVLTPHTYGPDVYVKSSFSAANYPANLPANWDALFGQFFQKNAVVVGEWGGKYGSGTGGQKDVVWQNAFVDYMISHGVRNSFYWAYTPNSGDTGGILDDNLNVRQDKLALLKKLWGTPTTGAQLQSCANIMPLGDSITLGVNGGYRNNLYTGLQQFNCGVSYVGTQVDPNTRVADKHHEGHSGFTIGNIAGSVNAWAATTQPDIVVLMAGTNDTAWWTAESAEQIGARHNALIDQLRGLRPNAWIFVASIPPQASAIIQPNNIDRAVLTQQFNAVVQRNVQARAAAGQRVRFVDVNSVLTTADLYDGIHPTEAAHAKVAQKVLEAMRSALGGPATPSSSATPPTSATPPPPSATPPPTQPAPVPVPPPSGASPGILQQGIQSFSPSSGPVGTVVTLNGNAFTGTTLAWVGAAKNGVVKVLSDTQLQVTIPAGATTGSIGIFNASYAAFTATSFTVTAGAVAADPQQGIQSFSPSSGAVGTVVTLHGSGFTGTHAAWVGAAKNAAVKVLSDTRMQVTIPAGATSGAIGIFNASRAAFTATSFTVVTSSAATDPQQGIMNFAPASGAVGTVVTLNGNGFTGTTSAWVGAARNAAVKVLSDTQMQVTIPAGATSGAIGIFNPTRAAFTATGFTVR